MDETPTAEAVTARFGPPDRDAVVRLNGLNRLWQTA